MNPGGAVALLRRPILWLALPAVALVMVYNRAYPSVEFVQGNWAAVAGQSTLFLLFSAGLASVGGAFEGGRVRRARLFAQPVSRPRLQVLVGLLLPAIILGILVQTSAFLMLGRAAIGSPGAIPFPLLIAQAAAILLHLMLGFTLGRALPIAAAVPGALLLSYSWLGFTGAISYTPLRYLSGLAAAQCCSVDTKLNVAGPIATAVFSLGCAAILVAFGVRFPAPAKTVRVARLSLTFVAITALGVASMWIARDVGFAPVVDRPPSEARCEGSDPEVCLFPEQAADRITAPVVSKAVDNLTRAGLPAPELVSGARGVSTATTRYAYFSPTMDPAQVLHSYLSSYFPAGGPRFCGDGSDYDTRLRIRGAMGTWLIAKASPGIVRPAAVLPIGQDGEALGRAVLRRAPSDQLAWYERAVAVQASCSRSLQSVVNP